MEISRTTKFLTDRGATVTAELTSDHYMRSPLIQGGVEIPCKVTGKISEQLQTTHNGEVQTACTGAVHGTERRGNFGLLLAEANGNDLTIAASSIAPEVQMKDIRKFFNRNQTQRDKPDQTLNEEVTNQTV